MMRTLSFRLFCFVISIIIMMSAFCVTASAEDKIEYTGDPVIFIPGFMQSRLQLTEDGETREIWPVKLDEGGIARELLWDGIKAFSMQKDLGISERATAVAARLLEKLRLDRYGEPVYDVTAVKYNKPLSECSDEERAEMLRMFPIERVTEDIPEDKIFLFAYNWLLDPLENSDDLKKFIDFVCEKTGSDSVQLVPVSMGGAVTNAYFSRYADEKRVSRVVYVTASMQGSDIFGDLMGERVDVSLEEFRTVVLPTLFKENTVRRIDRYVKYLPEEAVNNFVAFVCIDLIEIIGRHSAAVWAVTPVSEYPELRDKMLQGEEYSKLKEKTDRFYDVQKNLPELLKAVQENGAELLAICGYGEPLMIPEDGDRASSDRLLTVCSASCGAYSAPLGKTLGENYAQKNTYCANESHNHISPDNTVDASAGLFPEQTWYFKMQPHTDLFGNDKIGSLTSFILSNNGRTDIYSDARYPQFSDYRDTSETQRLLSAVQSELPDMRERKREKLSSAAESCKAAMNGADGDELTAESIRLKRLCGFYRVGYGRGRTSLTVCGSIGLGAAGLYVIKRKRSDREADE